MIRYLFVACALALLAGCGYVGDPLPPALNIPLAVADLRALQRADKILVAFTAPAVTSDDIVISRFSAAQVQLGDEIIPIAIPEPGASTQVELPARHLAGREVVVRVVLTGPKGQKSPPSNVVMLRVLEPLPAPTNVRAESHAEGVRVSWSAVNGAGTKYRVSRVPEFMATVNSPEFIDRGIEVGKEYRYSVVALSDTSESLPSAVALVTPVDKFAPAAPMNLNVIAGVNTVELSWDRSPEPDLKSYRVYRDDKLIASDVAGPAFSDKQLQSGQRYRYTVTAVDHVGNESEKSPPAETVAP